MHADELRKAPKLFVENIRLGYGPEYFVMGIKSGNQGHTYSLTPGSAKRLMQYLEHEIKAFEAKHGDINATWDPNVVSPVQRAHPPRESS